MSPGTAARCLQGSQLLTQQMCKHLREGVPKVLSVFECEAQGEAVGI